VSQDEDQLSLFLTEVVPDDAGIQESFFPQPAVVSDRHEQQSLLDTNPDWAEHWRDMPSFNQQNLMPYQSVIVNFHNRADRQSFARLVDQNITERTASIWYPKAEISRSIDDVECYASSKMRYPVFIPSKGRADTCYTMQAFDRIGVDYTVFVEQQDFEAYSKASFCGTLHVLPHSDKGLVVTRNYIWDHAERLGVERFWTFDDNIRGFVRLVHNKKNNARDASMFCAIEDFCDKYENIVIAGCNYTFFAKRKQKIPAYVLNTRVYSNMLIKTDSGFRNEGFYNDDTDLCLRVLKAGLCTVQFNAFLIAKAQTMTVKGGMTPHYQGDGRAKMAQELADKHPDVVKITHKFQRTQHQVDYSHFKQALILKNLRRKMQ